VPFCLGIFCEFFFNTHFPWLISSGIVLFVALIFYIIKKYQFLPLTAFLFMQLGYFGMFLNNPAEEAEPIGAEYYQLRILETSDTRKEWNKGLAHIEYGYTEGKPTEKIDQNVLFYTDSNSIKLLSEGDVILLSSALSKIENKGNPGEFNSTLYWKSKNTSLLTFFNFDDFSIVNNQPTTFKKSIQESLVDILNQNLPQNQIGIAKALFLGDKSSLDYETTSAFSAAGAMHLLAISGLHIGLMILVLMQFFRVFSKVISKIQALIFIIILIWFYAFIIGFPPSVVRSVFMFSLISLGSVLGSQKSQLNLLCFSALVLLLIHPWYLFDIGFQLSYAAMFGIFFTYTPIQQFIPLKNRVLKFLWNGTALGLAAQVFTIPLCIYYFHQFPNYFALTNLGIIIISGLLITFGIALFLFSWSPLFALITGTVLSGLLFVLIYFIQWIEQLPGAVAKGFLLSEMELFIFYALLCCILVMSSKKLSTVLKYVLIVGLFTGISFHRYHNINSNHLLFFNNSKLSFALHIDQDIYFFYDDEENNKMKYDRLLDTYERSYPGKIHLISIKDKNIDMKINGRKLKIEALKKRKKITFNRKCYTIEYDNTAKPNPELKQIGMPWVKGLNTTLNKSIIYPF